MSRAWALRIILATTVAAAGLTAAAFAVGVGPFAREHHPELAHPSRPVAAGLIAMHVDEGRQLLFESEAHAAFLPLAAYFETQLSLTHCGPASIAMVLNALGVPAPVPSIYEPHRLFTQEGVLNGLTEHIVDDSNVYRRGMLLEEVAEVLRVYDVMAEAHYAEASSIDHFRTNAVDHLEEDGRHVLVNYSRSALGQDGGGHISPLAAYDADSDRFLIMDVSRYKAPPVWVSTEQLFAAMAEPVDEAATRTRGFVLVQGPVEAS